MSPTLGSRRVTRRTILAGAGLAATTLAGGATDLIAAPTAVAATTSGSSGPYSLQTPYFSIQGQDGAVTSLAFSPDGSGSYGDNLLAAPGLYFQFLSDGGQVVATSSQATYEVGSTSLRLTIPVYSFTALAQTQHSNGYDITGGGGAGQTFIASSGPLAQLGINLFAAFGKKPTGDLSVKILTGGPSGTQVFATMLTPADLAQISPGTTLTYVDLSGLTLTAGKTYFIELTTSDADWGVQYENAAVYSGGEFYGFGGLNPQPGKEMAFVLVSMTGTLEYQAVWTLTANGPVLSSTIAVTSEQAHTLTKTGFELVTAWESAGYDTTNPTTTPFTRFFDSEGQYLPIEVFKRRPAMWGEFSFDIGANSVFAAAGSRKWITATGQRGYNLEFAWPNITLHFAMSSDTMTYKFYQSGYASSSVLSMPVSAGATVSFPFDLTVSAQSEAVPDWYPVFSSSNTLVDKYMSGFYWARGFGWLRGAYGSDWLDWMGLVVDWQGGPQREGQRILLEAVTQSPDGYVWTWNPPGAEAWPFPGAPYDSRHFTTNGMYILGINHYYSWTGDPEFLAKMLPKAELAMKYYIDEMDGGSGLVTVDRGLVGTTGRPAHTGEDGSPGTNYWDLISYGWKDAYVNLYFYGAIGALAELELAAGNRAKGRKLIALGNKVSRAYNSTFWTEVELPGGKKGGRFIQTVDQRGVRHDHGATYLNLEAMRFGLPGKAGGRKILDWLDGGLTELTTNLVMVSGGGPSITIDSGQTAAQSFRSPGEFAHVTPQISTNGADNDASEMTLSLYVGGYPNGTLVASRHYVGVYNGGFSNVLEVPVQPSGDYYLEVSDTSGPIVWAGSTQPYAEGTAYHNGSALSSPPAFSFVLVTPHQAGPADIYSRWGWAPRTTTKKNNFNYVWLWSGVTVPWGTQLEDGGADLYEVGFDVIARSHYSTADDAFARMEALLQRYSLPDRLCGGAPLFLGEQPQNEVGAGAVGVDVPFPESGLAPSSFLYAILGVEATPTRFSIRPKLPSTMEWGRVTNVAWRGNTLTITVYRDHVDVEGMPGPIQHHPYRPGERVVLYPAKALPASRHLT